MPQITITIPDAAVPRIKTCYRSEFPQGLNPEDGQPYPEPTNAEYLTHVKEVIKEFLRREVRDFERREAARAAEQAVTDIEVQD